MKWIIRMLALVFIVIFIYALIYNGNYLWISRLPYGNEQLDTKKTQNRYYNLANENNTVNKFVKNTGNNFEETVNNLAKDGIIVISSLTARYSLIAENLYVTLLKKFSVTNYIFICFDEESYIYMLNKSINAFHIKGEKTMSRMQVLYSRFDYVYRALKVGLTVLHLDSDIYFFRNPLPYMVKYVQDVHMVAQTSTSHPYCAGFFFVRSTVQTISLFDAVRNISKGINDQDKMNNVIKALLKNPDPLKIKALDPILFQNTRLYYLNKNKEGNGLPREFSGDNPYKVNYAVHSTFWPTPVKNYYLREHLFWQIDENGYYSDMERKYITYTINQSEIPATEQLVLFSKMIKFAANINRTLILPSFQCKLNQVWYACNLYSFSTKMHPQKIQGNDIFSIFTSGKVKEHMFLLNPLVPDIIKSSTVSKKASDLFSTEDKRYKGQTQVDIMRKISMSVQQHVLNVTFKSAADGAQLLSLLI